MSPSTNEALEPKADGSLYLTGNYAPVRQEITAVNLPVTGEIPAELSGRLLRNGPNPITPPDDPVGFAWMPQTGMVHGVRLRDGKAEWYRNRFVRGSEVVSALGAPPVPGPTRGVDDSCNTNIMRIGRDIYAVAEAGGLPLCLSYELDTVARSNFNGTMGDAFTAHPRTDPETGEIHAITYSPQYEKVQYQVVTTEGLVRRIIDVPLPGRPMVHDMCLTLNYVVLMDMPLTFSPEAAMAGDRMPFRWTPEHGARVGLLPRDGRAEDVVWCELPGTPHVYHTGNAYEDDNGNIIMDVVRYESAFYKNRLSPFADAGRLYRWTVNGAKRTVTEQPLDDRAHEFPRHDERLVGRYARYAYTVASDDDDLSNGFRALVKYDHERGTSETADYGPGRSPMETVFVPSADSTAEDDGWLMAYVHDATTQRCDVVIRHAQDLTKPVATIHIPVRVPFGFHGNWVADLASDGVTAALDRGKR